MVKRYPELVLPDGEATAADIAMGDFELIPGVNVPRDASSSYHLSSKIAKIPDKVQVCLSNKKKKHSPRGTH